MCNSYGCEAEAGRQLHNPGVPVEKGLPVSITQLLVQREAGEQGAPQNKVLTLHSLLCFSLLHVKGVLLDWCDFNKDREPPPSQSREKNEAREERGVVMETGTVLFLRESKSMEGT